MSETPAPDYDHPVEQGVSLRELSDAFARATGDKPKLAPGLDGSHQDREMSLPLDAEVSADCSDLSKIEPDEARQALAPGGSEESDSCEISPLSLLEAMLFVGNQGGEPLDSVRAAELMRDVEPGEIPDLVDQLNQRYAARGCPYHIVSEGAGYRMTLRREFWPIRNRFYGRLREARLSQAAIEVLSIVAYRQPVTAEEVSQIRDHPSGHVLTQLVRRRLLRVERDPDKPRVARYHTTDRFLELFGLESLDDLPRSDSEAGNRP